MLTKILSFFKKPEQRGCQLTLAELSKKAHLHDRLGIRGEEGKPFKIDVDEDITVTELELFDIEYTTMLDTDPLDGTNGLSLVPIESDAT